MTDYDINTRGLDQILKALKAKPPVARIGILGAGARQGAKNGPTNAEIGAWHEFGTSKLPQRSFLRIPISENLEKRMAASGAFDEDVLKDVIATGSVVAWVQKVAILAGGIVADAFDSGGFGKWIPSNMAHKKNHQTLVETQQLRNSITSEVTSG